MWDRPEDAEMRLNGCVVLFDKKPALVEKVASKLEGLFVSALMLEDGMKISVRITDERWDWKPFRTGYVNFGGKTYFIERCPVRKWKQGLHPDNIRVTPDTGGMNQLVRTKEFVQSLQKAYPSMQDCLRRVRDRVVQGQAFSQLFAITQPEVGPPFLEYMGMTVGWAEGDELKLGPEFTFLKESLQEALEAA